MANVNDTTITSMENQTHLLIYVTKELQKIIHCKFVTGLNAYESNEFQQKQSK